MALEVLVTGTISGTGTPAWGKGRNLDDALVEIRKTGGPGPRFSIRVVPISANLHVDSLGFITWKGKTTPQKVSFDGKEVFARLSPGLRAAVEETLRRAQEEET